MGVLFVLGFVVGRVFFTKEDFFKGFNGKRMVEDDGDCHFFRISYNWYGVFDNMLWELSHLNSNCSAQKIVKIKPSWPTDFVAFPRSERFSNELRQHHFKFQ